MKLSAPSRRSTPSVVSLSGPTPSDKPGGPKTEKSGVGPHHANHSASPAAAAERTTHGTCGQTSFDSSMPRDPPSFLANRLVARLATVGSTESPLIWKAKTTPVGRTIFRLAPSTRRTSETDSTGAQWSTPRSSDGEKGGPNQNFGAGGTPLPAQMHQATWPTPQSRDHHGAHTAEYIQNQRAQGNGCSNLNDTMTLVATWRTPQNRATAGGSYSDPEKAKARAASGHQVNLEDQMVAQWATPTTRDFRSGKASPETHARNARPLNEQMTNPSGPTASGSSATTEKRGVPNPEFPCWLQGLPEEYLCGGRWVTPSARRSRSK